jgi:hypothetical protein
MEWDGHNPRFSHDKDPILLVVLFQVGLEHRYLVDIRWWNRGLDQRSQFRISMTVQEPGGTRDVSG